MSLLDDRSVATAERATPVENSLLPTRHRSRRRMAAVTALVLAAGAGGWWWSTHRPTAAATDTATVVTAPVERRSLEDSTSVQGTAAYAQLAIVNSPRSGVVTSVGVKTGQTVAAGTELFRVQGLPVVAMTGTFPFWRSLKWGDRGVDVRQLETFLRQSGGDPGPVDTLFDRKTRAALIRWQKAHHLTADGVLAQESVAVTGWPARVGSVSVTTGSAVGAGGQALRLTRPTLTVKLDLSPAQVTRVKTGNKVQVRAGAKQVSGVITAIADQPTTGDNPVYRADVRLKAKVATVDGSPVTARIVVAAVTDALVVPMAAVVQDGNGAPVVRTRDADGRISTVAVKTGIQSGAFVAVTGALTEGAQVVIGTT